MLKKELSQSHEAGQGTCLAQLDSTTYEPSRTDLEAIASFNHLTIPCNKIHRLDEIIAGMVSKTQAMARH